MLRAGADRFAGPEHRHSASYALVYRTFNHGRMRKVCESLDAATSSAAIRQQLGRSSLSNDVRALADAFCQLQEAKLRADYDPAFSLPPVEAFYLVNLAEFAIAAIGAGRA